MPNFATYHAIHDGSLTLSPFGDEEQVVKFNPPNDIILATSGVNRPVLSYRVDPSNDAQNLAFKVFIRQLNGIDVQVSSLSLSGTVSRTIFEIINGSHLHKGEQSILFKLDGGSGSAVVSDVIFWFMRNG